MVSEHLSDWSGLVPIPSRTPFCLVLLNQSVFFIHQILEEKSAQLSGGFSRCMLPVDALRRSDLVCFFIEPPGPVNVPLSENTFKTGAALGWFGDFRDSSQSTGMSKTSRPFPPKWSILHHLAWNWRPIFRRVDCHDVFQKLPGFACDCHVCRVQDQPRTSH